MLILKDIGLKMFEVAFHFFYIVCLFCRMVCIKMALYVLLRYKLSLFVFMLNSY